LNWDSLFIGIAVISLATLIFIEFRRWQNNRDSQHCVQLEILPPTGQIYYALAKKDEHSLTIKSPSQRDVKFTYMVDTHATWDVSYPSSDLSITQVNIKRVTYYEGGKEPALKRKVLVTETDENGRDFKVLKDIEIATPTLVALAKDGNDLRDIIREVNGDNGIFGANAGLVTIIVCGLVLIVSGVSLYYTYQYVVPYVQAIYNDVHAITQALGIHTVTNSTATGVK
jgi:hypothetical protein